jgi:hypothetical protein
MILTFYPYYKRRSQHVIYNRLLVVECCFGTTKLDLAFRCDVY